MGIDTSIYSNLLRPPKSVAELDAEAMQGQQNRLALQSTRMQMADRERGLAEDAQMRGVVSNFGADKTANYNALLKTGNIKAAQGYEKQNADTAKVQREAEKEAFTVAKQKLEMINNAIAGSKDPQSYAMNRQMLAQNGIDISQIPEQFDPAYIANAGQQAMTEIQRVDQAWKAKGFDLETQKFGETVRNNKEQTATSVANNKRTVGASYANAAATRSIATATRDAASIQRDQATEMKLGDDYRKQSKDFKDVGDAYRTINATLDQATKSPAATLAGATKFMKLLDPGSVVRESELGMALAATGVLDRAFNYVNTLKMGKVLTVNQVKDFKAITEQVYAAAQVGQRDVDANYTKQAKAYKLRPEMIVQDLGQNTSPGGAKFLGFE